MIQDGMLRNIEIELQAVGNLNLFQQLISYFWTLDI